MDLVVYDDDEKRYVPWAVALAAVLLVALVSAGVTFLLARASGAQEPAFGGRASPAPATAPSTAAQASAEPPAGAATTTAPEAAPTTPAECVTALLRADAALERSVSIDEALTQHTEIVDELLAERITVEQALDRALPVLTDGATERREFQEQLAAYSEAREACPA